MTSFKLLLCPFGFLVLVLSHTHQAAAQSSRTANNRMERRARFSTPPVPLAVQERAPETFAERYFDQLIDHKKKALGTFKQRYWLSGQTYFPGGPILLASGDDDNGEDSVHFIKQNGLMGRFARGMLGASVVLEHRYFGKSLPYDDYSEKNLKYLTIKQSVEDLVYFAKTVNLQMPGGGSAVHPDNVPWIIFGGGYTGALANWAMLRAPDIFFAGYASSPTVQALENHWEFWDFIRQKMPQNCSADVQAVSGYIDKVARGNKAQHRNLIKELGLQKVHHLADAAASIPAALRTWQYLQPGQEGIFFEFCDALEVYFLDPPPAEGRGLEFALASIGRWNRERYGTEGLDTDEYWGTQWAEDPTYTDLKTNGTQDRPRIWLRCNELGWFHTGAPRGLPSLVPRILNVERERGICAMYFPVTYRPSTSRFRKTNSAFGGWKKRAKRLYVTDGANNAWTGVTFAAPGAKKYNKGMLEVQISEDGFHMSDLWTKDRAVDDLRVEGFRVIMDWLQQWEPKKSSKWKSWMQKLRL